MILQGFFPQEIFGRGWSEVDADLWVVPKERSKNGRSNLVPLSRPAVEVFAAATRHSSRCSVAKRPHLMDTTTRLEAAGNAPGPRGIMDGKPSTRRRHR